MLFAAPMFGPCILNAITQFITSWIESVKLQMIIAQYSPLNDGAMNVLPKHEMMVSTMSDRSIKKGGMKRKSLNFT